MRLFKLVETVAVHVNCLWNYDLAWEYRINYLGSENPIRSLGPLLVVDQSINIDREHK